MQFQVRTGSRSGSGAAGDPKKRKSEDRLGDNGKKSKQDTSSTSPPKVSNSEEYLTNWFKLSEQVFKQLILSQTQAEVPDVKSGERDKIIALQQIISPYGKVQNS